MEEKFEELDKICNELKVQNKECKNIEKIVGDLKEKVKTLFGELNIDKYSGENYNISMTTIDKSYLDEARTIEYLKSNGLSKYIKTKEYFDPNELVMAGQLGELDIATLSQFRIEKIEKRLNIK